MFSAILRHLRGKSRRRSAQTAARLQVCEKQLAEYKSQLDIELLRLHRLERELEKTSNEVSRLTSGLDYIAYYRSKGDDQDSTLIWIRDWLDGKSKEVKEFEAWRSDRDARKSSR